MNKEDYVSLEVAKLLEEKGFDEKCNHYWWRHGNETRLDSDNFQFTKEWLEVNNNCYDEVLLAPTLYEAQKWLREKYMIYISSLPTKDNGITVWYLQIVKDTLEDAIYSRVSPNTFNTYEEALNEGILEALKLI